MKGKEIPARPASAIGSFSSSDILSVFLREENIYYCEFKKRRVGEGSLFKRCITMIA
jgi:hypothetical protein